MEKAVGEKKRLRRMLHGAGLGSEWWPMALGYAMETDRMWAVEPTHEARYLTPLVEAHGHCVLRAGWGIAPYVIRNIEKPPTEEWRSDGRSEVRSRHGGSMRHISRGC